MHTTTKHESKPTAQEMLASVGQLIEKLEAELSTLRQENEQLRAERNEYRKVLKHVVKDQIEEPKA